MGGKSSVKNIHKAPPQDNNMQMMQMQMQMMQQKMMDMMKELVEAIKGLKDGGDKAKPAETAGATDKKATDAAAAGTAAKTDAKGGGVEAGEGKLTTKDILGDAKLENLDFGKIKSLMATAEAMNKDGKVTKEERDAFSSLKKLYGASGDEAKPTEAKSAEAKPTEAKPANEAPAIA
jgi:hypothetical protein